MEIKKSNGMTEAMLYQVESIKHILVEREHLLEKCANLRAENEELKEKNKKITDSYYNTTRAFSKLDKRAHEQHNEILSLNKENESIEQLKETIRSREAESESYRKLYNDLKNSVIELSCERTGATPYYNPTPKQVLVALKNTREEMSLLSEENEEHIYTRYQLKLKLQNADESIEYLNNEANKWKSKYERLTRYMREWGNSKVSTLLKAFYKNEKQRGKK